MQPINLRWERLESRLLFDSVPLLHSNPFAEHKIYLDFDGHVTMGTSWNLEFPSITSPPFSIDEQLHEFSEIERSRIVSIWERMAEDFLPFNVDVTTEDPTTEDPEIFFEGGRGQRVVFTTKFHTPEVASVEPVRQWFESDAPGAAVESWYAGQDTPVFVFSTHQLAGEIGSHEVGHAVGLHHDSAIDESGRFVEYRGEHGGGATRWSPIMGHGNALSQWSKGEYPGATNFEPDIGILTRALGLRADDYVGVVELSESGGCDNGPIEREGFIGTSVDTDIFAFEVCRPTMVKLEISPWHNGPNVDIGVTVFDAFGTPLIRSTDDEANPRDALYSVVNVRLNPGSYYLQVDGVGKSPSESDPGYSDYGSLGYYRISGSLVPIADVGPDQELSMDFDSSGAVDEIDFQILQSNFGAKKATPNQGDLNTDNKVGFDDFLIFASRFESVQ